MAISIEYQSMKTTSFLLLCLSSLFSQGSDVTMKPKHISIFKNGYGFVTMEGKIASNDRQMRLRQLPTPSIGTFWVESSEGVHVERVVSGLFPDKLPRSYNLMELAAANPGAKVRLRYRDHSATTELEGTLLPFPTLSQEQQGNTIDVNQKPDLNPTINSVLLIKDVQGAVHALQGSSILNIVFLSDIKMPHIVKEFPGIELHLKQTAMGKTVVASSLSSGITWLPSYRMELCSDNKARFIAKATITNQLMDVESASIDLITGAPSLENPNTIDPMVLRTPSRPSPVPYQQARANLYKNSMSTLEDVDTAWEVEMDEFDDSGYMKGAGLTQFIDEKGVVTNSLFFFPIENFSAKLGQVVTQNLFAAEIDYKRVCTWTLGDPQLFPVRVQGDRPDSGEVWYCVRFTNPLKMPISSAPIEFMEQNRIAGTNTLRYTGINQECTVSLNTAINVQTTKQTELLSQKKITSGLIKKTTNTLETHRVTLGVRNSTNEAIEIEVEQYVMGKVTKVENDGKLLTRTNRGSLSNPANSIKWKLIIEPGQTKQLHFEYEYLR